VEGEERPVRLGQLRWMPLKSRGLLLWVGMTLYQRKVDVDVLDKFGLSNF